MIFHIIPSKRIGCAIDQAIYQHYGRGTKIALAGHNPHRLMPMDSICRGISQGVLSSIILNVKESDSGMIASLERYPDIGKQTQLYFILKAGF